MSFRWPISFCLSMSSLLLASSAIAETEAQTKPAEAPEVEEADADADLEKLGAPGEHHEGFERGVGNWRTETRLWMSPDAPPESSEGSCKAELILGGRFLRQECDGEMMGHPFSGIGVDGYDNYRQQYTSTWIDSMSTSMSLMTGTCDEKGNCTYHGRMDDPRTGRLGKTMKTTIRWLTRDKFVFEMFDAYPGGEWYRVLEVAYFRVK